MTVCGNITHTLVWHVFTVFYQESGKKESNVKATGIVRKVDELGRIVLPIEMRRTLDIAEKDALEIYVEGSSVILKKYKPSCIFCDSTKDITVFKGKNVCPKCLKELKSL